MLVGGLIGVVIVVAVLVTVVVRSRSHDDEHSVEHYHRQMHTLEELQSHPSEGQNGNANANDESYPASAFRVSGSSTVRLTESGHQVVPPVPPPPVPNPERPVTFGDGDGDGDGEAGESGGREGAGASDVGDSDKGSGTFMSGSEDRAMHGINHRPRRLAGPAAAVAAVLVLIVVLIVTGIHTSSPSHKGKSPSTVTTATTPHNHPRAGAGQRATTSTTTTAPPVVSAPQTPTAHGATYQVSGSSFSLALAANGGECWVDATSTTNGSVLFTATLFSGQSHTITATGPVTVIAGAPGAFEATVNGAAVALPPGNQAPFTLRFETPTPA